MTDFFNTLPYASVVLEPLNDTFVTKRLELYEAVKIGRKVNVKTGPEPTNGVFDSKVLSRNHAEIWQENGQVFIRDVKSSNGTFVNGSRLSEEGQPSASYELHSGDEIEFGIDILNDDNVTSKHLLEGL
ncbi:SMAD/FHA domain-containing protein [Cladochytrium replicatum]|nr:SMAD/FHA domain-containing protein [Cladochytrium replicatum]